MADRSERGAVIALLQDQPSDLTWRRLAAEVGDSGSAVEICTRLSALDLFSDPEGLDWKTCSEHSTDPMTQARRYVSCSTSVMR